MARRQRRPAIQHAEIVRGFAERLKSVRRARGMTQSDLARNAATSESHVRKLEGGKVAPGIDLLDRLASALGTTPADLLPVPAPPAELEVLREQVRQQIEALLQSEDAQTLAMIAQLLARVRETTPRSSQG